MNHEYECFFQRVQLKPLEQKDIELLRELRNQNCKYFLSQGEITEEEQKNWYQRYLSKNDDIMFKIVKKKEPERFIGAVALYDIDLSAKTAEFGRIIVDKTKALERGIGTEAVIAVCLFGFRVLHLEQIICDVLTTNERAVKTYKNVGFQITGEREGVYDMILMKEHFCQPIS